MQRRYKQLAGSFLLVSGVLFCSSVAWADVTGSILGIVRDKTQAVVAGAHIVATNVETNFSKETMTEPDGQYRILALPTGTYRVTATASGFQQFTATAVDLKVNDQLRIDIVLEVGSVQQQISVQANAMQVETESTQLGSVIETQTILAMPLNGRSYLDLLPLQVGVVPVTSGTIPNDRPVSGMFANPGNVSVNGQPESANAFLVNGGDVSETKNMGAGLIPNLDSIQEFRLITNSYDAEYGRFSGAVMNAVTKSGTNSIHGDVFEFLRNDTLDARNFFDPTKAELRQNQFGYAVGGPAWRNKLFWFSDYQGTRNVSGASTGLLQLPTTAQRQGIFDPSALTGSVNGNYWAQVLTQRLGYAVQSGEPYSSSGCTLTSDCVFPGGVIPQRAFDKPSVNMLPYIPVGNLSPSQGLYADDSQKAPIVDNKLGQRVDFVNQKTGNWSFYYHYDDSTTTTPLNASFPGFPSITPERAQMVTMSNTKTLSPTAVNEFRLSFFRTSTTTNIPTGGYAKLSDLGFTTGVGTLGIVPSGPAGYPQMPPWIQFNNFTFGPNQLTLRQANNTWHASNSFSKVAGSHTLKVGGDFRYYQLNVRNVCCTDGGFFFSGGETGSDFADFLLGAPDSFFQASEQFLNNRSRYAGVFVQDSWKVKPNLTLNLGLRWEVSMPWYDTQGELETLVPGAQSQLFPLSPKGYLVPGDPGVPSTISPTRWDTFAPRIGVAYSPNFTGGILRKLLGGPGKTSIRAAYGIYYLSQADLGNFGVIGDPPFGMWWSSSAPPLLDTPYLTRSDGVSQGQKFPFTPPVPGSAATKTLDFKQFEPLWSPGYSNQNKLTYAEHYNFSIQRELSKSTVLTAAFVGTQGHHLLTGFGLEAGSAALCNQLNAEGATPQCGPFGEATAYALPNGSQVYGTMVPTTNPGISNQALGTVAFGNANVMSDIANSNYNALQVSVERKAADVTFLGAYTFSKSIDNAQGLNPWNFNLTRVLSPFDMTHNFVASYTWAVPFDRGFSSLPKRLTQGWDISGITRFTTGFPITLSQSGDLAMTGLGLDYPNVVGPVVTQNPRKSGPNGPNTYFLPSAFASEQLGVIGDAAPRFFHGPGIINTDFGMTKMIAITESMAIQIRGEFFNVFNHANFNTPVGDFSSGQFGEVTSARAPRIGQVSAKFIW
jgi:hypothetical protein